MKILFPIGSIYPSQQGGPSNSVYWLSKGLVKEGVEVVIVSTDVMLENDIPRNIWLSTDYGKVIFHHATFHHFPFTCIKTAYKQLESVDIVHLNSVFYTYSLIMGFLALWKRKKIIWSVRGELDEKALIYSKWKKSLYIYFFKLFFSRMVKFHVTSKEEAFNIQNSIGKNTSVEVVPNFMVLPQKVETSYTNYISFIGRIHPIKGIDFLIKSLAKSNVFLQSNFILKIAGNTENKYSSQLKDLAKELGISDRVQFIGFLDKENKEIFLANSYFTFLPSHSENFGLVVIESLAQGTPVVASKGTPWQKLEENEIGYWVDNDIDSLTKVIDHILKIGREEYQLMRSRAYSYAQSNFDIFKNINKWLELYKR